MKAKNKWVLIIIVCLTISGCAVSRTPGGGATLGFHGSPFYWDTVGPQRQAGLRKLQLGMTRTEVEAILPEPDLVEVPEAGTEFLVYYTSPSKSTPVALLNGKVIGWGESFYVNKEQKHTVTIK